MGHLRHWGTGGSVLGAGSVTGTVGAGGIVLCGELVSAGLWGDGTLETLETLGTGGGSFEKWSRQGWLAVV